MGHHKRMVITGMGALSPVGNDVPSLWQAMKQGRSGVAPITHFDAAPYETRFAAEVKGFDALQFIDKKEARRSSRLRPRRRRWPMRGWRSRRRTPSASPSASARASAVWVC